MFKGFFELYNPFRYVIDNAIATRTTHIPLNQTERRQIDFELQEDMAKFDKPTYILGGSYALGMFLGEGKVESDDIDIIISHDNANNDWALTHTLNIFTEAEKIYNSFVDMYITLTSDKEGIKYNIHGDIMGRHKRSFENEDFNKSIVGTINCVSKRTGKKIQYVVVNQTTDTLERWYANASDLPVFITLNGNSKYYYLKSLETANDALKRILTGIKHNYRIDKYTQKGFVCK